MTEPRAGATRECPHCHETILESALVCPACRHKLRFASARDVADVRDAAAALTPLRVEGSFRNPADSGSWEYSMVLTICNARGEEIAHRVVGVGAMQPGEERTFTLGVEMHPARNNPTRH